MIGDYFEFLKKVSNKNPEVVNFRLIREVIGVKKGFIRFVIKLRDDSELHVFEYKEKSIYSKL
jgi:hypothetical protein